ncbi:MAG: NAD-dependent epimerase/dehydratase family protein [Eubacteriales bacterium]|nr:NAD-dependent epimerase/dehydratase family protein [Eubacteriales bacterium]
MADRIYLVTGASGHLGNQVVRRLLDRGEEVRCLIVEEELPLSLQGLDLNVYHGDVRNRSSIEAMFQGLDGKEIYFLHLASMISIASKVDPLLKEVNVGGTINVIELCKKYQVKRLLYCSSVHAIPERKNNAPINELDVFSPDWVHGAYAKTKAIATQLVMEAGHSGLDVVVVQPSGIIGPYDYMAQGRLNQLMATLVNRRHLFLVHGGYDIVDVRDVAKGLLAAVDRGRSGECYILSNKYCSITELIQLASESSGIKVYRFYVAMFLARMFAPITEWWAKLRRKRPLYTPYALYTLRSNSNLSHKKASKELGYSTRPIEETIQDTLDFILEQQAKAKLIGNGVASNRI